MQLTKYNDQPALDLAGLGVGPFNLSIAALLDSKPEINASFFDAKKQFSWHPGLMLPGAHMQTSCLKDMVTAVQPTSRWSFLSYLVEKGRFYQFLSTEKLVISRHEFVDYMSWVAAGLESLQFDSEIREVSFDGEHFVLRSADNKLTRANNICLGTGKVPHLPSCARPYISDNCFHASELAARPVNLEGKRVAIVGGGQTGAEVFLNALRQKWGTATEISWVSRRSNFEPLDESPFTNELFTPEYVDQFLTLPADRRDTIVRRQKLASDGITPLYLQELYRELYDRKYLFDDQTTRWELLPDRTLTGMDKQSNRMLDLRLENALSGGDERLQADVVILCTGFEHKLPQYLEPLMSELELDDSGRFTLSPEFRVQWNGPTENRIYAVNAGMHSHGIAEPQLSLAAWRSAVIINDMAGREVFHLPQQESLIRWK
ncbi:lysine N(6)-hydroxylase/L-ornithine N(5)-oxygenase family protein [Endozoicomonadaceae bacterium StTr2]